MKKFISIYTAILSKLLILLCIPTFSLYCADFDPSAKKSCIASISSCLRRMGCLRKLDMLSQDPGQLSDLGEREGFFNKSDYVEMSDVESGLGVLVVESTHHNHDALFLNNMSLSSAEDLQEKIDELSGAAELDVACLDVYARITHLYLALNNLRATDLGILPAFSTLQYLYLNNNKLKCVPKEIKQLVNLKKLSLFVNEITRIDRGDFDGLDQLEHLNIGANKISVIESGALGGRNLRHIDLIGNKIVSLEKTMFGIVDKVETLDVSHNQIKALDPGLFRLFSCLKKMNLSSNHIEELKAHSFEGLNEIVEVDMRFNKIERADSVLVGELTGRLCLSLHLCSEKVRRQWLASNPMPKYAIYPVGGYEW